MELCRRQTAPEKSPVPLPSSSARAPATCPSILLCFSLGVHKFPWPQQWLVQRDLRLTRRGRRTRLSGDSGSSKRKSQSRREVWSYDVLDGFWVRLSQPSAWRGYWRGRMSPTLAKHRKSISCNTPKSLPASRKRRENPTRHA